MVNLIQKIKIVFFSIVLCLLYSCQESNILYEIKKNTKNKSSQYCTFRRTYNGWDITQCIEGESYLDDDYYRIIFYATTTKDTSDFMFVYATRKCYDVSTWFIKNCDFYIDFIKYEEFFKAKKIFYKLPKNYFKLIDEIRYPGTRIYFVSKRKQKKLGLQVSYISKKYWDWLNQHIKNIKFLDDL